MDYSWAQSFPEVYKACKIFNRTELLHVTKCVYTPLEGYRQQGPQCGLVALAMLMKSAKADNIDRIFRCAKEMGFTSYGEMFSAEFMTRLAKKCFKHARVELHSGELDCDKIKEFLLNGGLMLVPYDNDKDFKPAFKNGEKAHWCAVSGALQTADGEFYVIARQGKSLRVSIWQLKDLSASNAQLQEFLDFEMIDLSMPYVVPEGGIAGPLGLNKKAVLFYINKCD